MKSIMVINFFHSSQEKVGALRTQRFVRYFPQFGWMPWVITKPPWNGKRKELIKTTDTTFYAPSLPLNKPFHFEVFTWIPFMLAKAISVLRKHRIKVVLISCPPFYQALVGILLKKWFNVKLVVDYRDAWSLNPYYQRVSGFHQWILKRDRPLERSLLRHIDLLIVSHQIMRENHIRSFPFLRNRVEVVYNGFDQEEMDAAEEAPFSKFTILHLGDFYAEQKTRDPGLFLSALQKVIIRERIPPEKLQVLFLGERYGEIEKTISNLGLSPYVSCRERVPHPEATRYLKKSHLLLLIESMDVMTTKVFEYLATGKPILAFIKEGEIKDLIEKYSKNSYVLINPDFNQIITALADCYSNRESHHVEPDESFMLSFNRQNQTRQLAICLNKLIEK